MFFYLCRTLPMPPRARLGDTNRQLIETFLAVRDSVDEVNAGLAELQRAYDAADDKRAFYYELRDRYNARKGHVDAALFIFLNRTCWNGLYRVNREGDFNVPYGAPKTSHVIPRAEDLINASSALAQAELRATSWQNTVAYAQPGDFVFLDPPYYSDVVGEDTRTKYGVRPFGLREHQELARALVELHQRGVNFLLTNSGEPEMAELYSGYGLTVHLVQVPRPINSRAERRGDPVPELIVTPPRDLGVQPIDLSAEVALLPD